MAGFHDGRTTNTTASPVESITRILYARDNKIERTTRERTTFLSLVIGDNWNDGERTEL